MVIFHSYVSLPEGTIHFLARLSICTFLHGKISRKLTSTASARCPERCTVAAQTFPSKSKLMKSSQLETSIYSGCSYIFHDFSIVFLKKHSIYSGCCDFPMDLPWLFPWKPPFFMGSRWDSHDNLHVFPTFSKVPQHWWWHWSRPRGGRARPWPGENRERIAEGEVLKNQRTILGKWQEHLL